MNFKSFNKIIKNMSIDKLQSEKDEKLKLLSEELESVKLVAAYMETQREEELAYLKKRHEEEISSLQHIVREANQQNNQNGPSNNSHQYRQPPSTLHLYNDTKLLNPSLTSPEKESVLAKVLSILQKRSPQLEVEDLEISHIKAKEHADMLRSIVAPFDEEISDLNRQLKFYKSQYERKNIISGTSKHDFDSSDSEPSDEQLIDLNSPQPDALKIFPSSASTSCLATNSRQPICLSCQRLNTKCDVLESEILKLRKHISRLQNELVDRDKKIEVDMKNEVEKTNLEVNNLQQKLTELTSILTDSQNLLENLKIKYLT